MQAPNTALLLACLMFAGLPALACDSVTSPCPCPESDGVKGDCAREQRNAHSPAPASPAAACPGQHATEPAKRPPHTRFLHFA